MVTLGWHKIFPQGTKLGPGFGMRFLGWGLGTDFQGWGFQLLRFGACGEGSLRILGLGLSL